MKSIIFIILLLSVSNIQAQYQSIFGSTQTEWNFISLTCDVAIVDTYMHERDTTINDIEYHIINNWGLLRESDQNSKLWYRNFHDDDEILILDLSLSMGDTFRINSKDFIVDSVYLENNLKIIEFDYTPYNCGYYERLKFKEAMGPNLSFKFALTAEDFDADLLRCLTKDSITNNFLESYFGADCRSDLVNTQKIDKKDILVFPNPFSEELAIQFADNTLRTIDVYDMKGVQIFDKKTSLENIHINTTELHNGIYIIRILESKDERIFKVIKGK